MSQQMRRAMGWTMAAGGLALAAPAAGQTITIDFEGLSNGEIVPADFAAADGVTITGVNFTEDFDLLAAFDTSIPSLEDPDLNTPFTFGNAAEAEPGIVLIISEFGEGPVPGFVDPISDEPGAPDAGTITLSFETPIVSFGFSVFDLGPGEAGGSSISFFSDGELVGEVGFGSLTIPGTGFFDPTLVFGGGSANTVAPFLASDFEVESFDEVEFFLGGSTAFDSFTAVLVPTPAAAGLFGLAGFVAIRRRR